MSSRLSSANAAADRRRFETFTELTLCMPDAVIVNSVCRRWSARLGERAGMSPERRWQSTMPEGCLASRSILKVESVGMTCPAE
jgi:hypothetical protein